MFLKRNLILFCILIPLLSSLQFSQVNNARVYTLPIGRVTVSPNIRPYPSNIQQYEVDAKTMGGNTNKIFAAWKSYGPVYNGTGFCFSSNGGGTWSGNYQMFMPNSGDPGVWIWPAGSLWEGTLGISVIGGYSIVSSFSTNNGSSWQAPVNVGGNGADKNLSAVDDIPSSPYFGRVYTVWTDIEPPNVLRIVGSYTTNGGVSWIGYQPISPAPPANHLCQGADVAIGPGGIVYLTWATGFSNGQNSTEDYLGFAKSTNGGVNWTSNNNVLDINGIRTSNLYNGFRANSFPRIAVDKSGGARNGWIYIVTSEKDILPSRDMADICLCRSTDGGVTWTHTLVNQDPYGKYNYHPAITIDPNENIAVSYYDQRNTISPVTDYYMSFSTNGGDNWYDFQVSDHNFTPAPIPPLSGAENGDYTGLVFSNGKFWPFWNDNSTGVSQVWTAGISIQLFVNDIACDQFLDLPQAYSINYPFIIKALARNFGTANETNVPVKFFINNNLVSTSIVNFSVNQIDTISNSWNPSAAGTYQLMYVSALAGDEDRTNDTVKTTVQVFSSLPPLCENFEQSLFPPANWSLSGEFWLRAAGISGFGSGQGSAEYNMWNAPQYYDESLITSAFQPVGSSTGILYMDMAYSPFTLNGTLLQDSLIIFTSTNGGTSWASVSRLGPLQLQTASSIDSEFHPLANQWVKRSFVLPAGTNRIKFLGKSQFGNNLYLDSICAQDVIGITNNNQGVPTEYSLSQNYPNPFNPTTNIKYQITKNNNVKLTVFDILGKEVEVLVNEKQTPGAYSINWNADKYSSGVYFYKIESGSFTSVKKMILLK